MIRRLLLAGGVLSTAMSVAASTFATDMSTPARLGATTPEQMSRVSAASRVELPAMIASRKSHKAAAHSPAKAPLTTTPITETPEGQLSGWSRNSQCFYTIWGMVGQGQTYGTVVEMVEAADGVVYVSNPSSQNPNRGSWLKGTKDAQGTITIPGGQAVYTEEVQGETDLYVAMALELSVDEEKGATYVPCADQNFRLVLKDGKYVQENPEIMLGICLYYNGEYFWAGFGDLQNELTEVKAPEIKLPQGVEAEDWALVLDSGEGGYFVKVAIDGDKFYLGGLTENYPDAWSSGSIADGVATVEAGQYLGHDEWDWAYLYGGMITEEVDPKTGIYYKVVEIDGGMSFDFDADAKRLTPRHMIIETTIVGDDIPNSALLYYLGDFVIEKQERNPEARPAEPLDLYAMQESDESGMFSFYLPPVDVDNCLLDLSRIYYRVYGDGQPLTFSPDIYYGLEEETTLLPYNLILEDGTIDAYGPYHSVMFMGVYDELGVQTVYMQPGADTAVESEIATIENDRSRIDSITSGTAVVATSFFDLQGRRVERPAAGIFIRQDKMDDGSVRNSKVIRR